MPMTALKTHAQFFRVGLFRRGLLPLFVFLVFVSSATALRAQNIEIKLVNGRNGRPMANRCVNVWVGDRSSLNFSY